MPRAPNDPTFSQTIAIVRDILHRFPTEDESSQLEAIKRRHLELGFTYSNTQIHRALAAIRHGPTPPLHSGNRPWGR